MSRTWTHWAGSPIDAVGFGLLVLLALAGALLIGSAWHFFPRWLPRWSWFAVIARTWARVRRLRWSDLRRLWRWRRRKRGAKTPVPAPDRVSPAAADALPDLSAEQFISLADRYAAAGQYREAVRERLRAITRQLVDRRFITHHPEWTITELVRTAGDAAPAMRADLQEASGIFSDIWYGEREATRAHDDRMRELGARVDASAAAPVPAAVGVSA